MWGDRVMATLRPGDREAIIALAESAVVACPGEASARSLTDKKKRLPWQPLGGRAARLQARSASGRAAPCRKGYDFWLTTRTMSRQRLE